MGSGDTATQLTLALGPTEAQASSQRRQGLRPAERVGAQRTQFQEESLWSTLEYFLHGVFKGLYKINLVFKNKFYLNFYI